MASLRRRWLPRLLRLCLLVGVLALAFSRGCGEQGQDAERGGGGAEELPNPLEVTVSRVVDGDTIEVTMPDGSEEDVRYIGIDAPESVAPDQPVECGGRRSADANRELVEGRRVSLRFDAERRDDYGRLLAYVHRGELMVNAELLRRGLARTLTIPPNDSHAPLFARLAAGAGRAGRGLWGACEG
jgi:micrococcal nuclease